MGKVGVIGKGRVVDSLVQSLTKNHEVFAVYPYGVDEELPGLKVLESPDFKTGDDLDGLVLVLSFSEQQQQSLFQGYFENEFDFNLREVFEKSILIRDLLGALKEGAAIVLVSPLPKGDQPYLSSALALLESLVEKFRQEPVMEAKKISLHHLRVDGSYPWTDEEVDFALVSEQVVDREFICAFEGTSVPGPYSGTAITK